MTADRKALPEFRMRENGPLLSLLVRARSWPENSNSDANEGHIAAVLAAMDADRLARILDAAQVPELLVAELRQTQAELASERAKVARLEAFFAEHGEQTLSNVTCAAEANDPLAKDCLACKCERDLRAILATLPKGTNES
jgi:hypothetical protein